MQKFMAEEDVWELINNDPEFNKFIGQCVTHFTSFVIPRRDQTKVIEQDYQIPDSVDTIETSVLLRREKGNKIFIEFCNWGSRG